MIQEVVASDTATVWVKAAPPCHAHGVTKYFPLNILVLIWMSEA